MTEETNLYKIGAASKITGVNIATLRVWENRYGVVEPIRINGTQRGFTKKDVDRLSMIKQLVDSGDSISTLAKLSLEELELRMQPSVKNSQITFENAKDIINKSKFKSIKHYAIEITYMLNGRKGQTLEH